MPTVQYLFETPGNYTYDNSKIDITGGVAKLRLGNNPDQHFIEDFADDTDFTYDSALAEFTGGLVQQKQPISNAIFAHKFDSEDANWGDGSTDCTLSGATVSGNVLDCTGSDTDHIQIPGANFPTSKGCIRFTLIPNNISGGQPASSGYLFSTDGTNEAYLRFQDNGTFRCTVKNDSGSSGFDFSTPVKSDWVNGQEYEVEFNWDFDTQVCGLYLDGVRLAQDTSAVGVRTNASTTVYWGTYSGGISGQDASFKNIIVFNEAQHTDASYTPGYTIPDYRYSETKVDLPSFVYTGVGTVRSVDDATITETGSPRWIVGLQYWNGAAWVVSDGSYAQANDSATSIANLAEIDVGGSGVLPVSIVFPDTNTQSSVDYLDVEVTGQIYPTDDPQISINSGFLTDGLEGFTETATKTGSDELKYLLHYSGQDYYHNGANWVASNSTYAQSNTAAEIEAAKATFATDVFGASVGGTVTAKVLLHSDTGQTTPQIDTLEIDYNFFTAQPNFNKCRVYGQIHDASGNPVQGATVHFEVNDFWYGDTYITVDQNATTDSVGNWDVEIVETETSGETCAISITYIDDDGEEVFKEFKGLTIPNQESASLASLVNV